MLKVRVIPSLLLSKNGLVKTKKFKNPKYIGDPINAIRIFNEKEVDELTFLDIDASKGGFEPSYELLADIARECFMPFGYGGGIKTIDQIQKILKLGVEKVIINTAAFHDPAFVKEACRTFGSSTIVVSIDVKKNLFGKNQVHVKGGTENTKMDPVEYSKSMAEIGVGEILLNSIDRDGTYTGYDLTLVEKVSRAVNVPVVACGGAGSISDFTKAVHAGASGVSAGSLFVFHGKHQAVLITYPSQYLLAKEGL